MTRWHSQLLLLVSVVAATSPIFVQPVQSAHHAQHFNYKKTVLTVGYLTAIKGELKDKQGLAISGALTMALDEVFFYFFYLIKQKLSDFLRMHSKMARSVWKG